MDLIDKMRELASKIPQQFDYLQTEEATKTALIMPFISALGYDVFNPLEVIPEFTADIGTKKGEKVDYAVKKDDKIIMLIECKWSGCDLDKEHASQLYRYFSATEARFGILTNGVRYLFYSDIEEPNKMDSKPFLEFDMLDFEEHDVKELKKFSKSAFSLEDILTTASKLKYAGAIRKILEQELESPSTQFVRFFASQIYDGKLTQNVIKKFTGIVKDAERQFINEKINERLKSALSADEQNKENQLTDEEISEDIDRNIITTDEEIEGYNIVKAILREIIDVDRIAIRDRKNYCGILLDDNNRKPICRLHFNGSQKYIGLFAQKKEQRVAIDSLNDIFKYAEQLKAAIREYDN